MAVEIDFDTFETAVRLRIARSLQDDLEGRVLPEIQRRTGPGGDIFLDPSGATSASLTVTETDPGNTRGWRYTISSDTPGAFFTNMGEVLTPNLPPMAMRWIGKQGQVIFSQRVDHTRTKGWLRKAILEALGHRN